MKNNLLPSDILRSERTGDLFNLKNDILHFIVSENRNNFILSHFSLLTMLWRSNARRGFKKSSFCAVWKSVINFFQPFSLLALLKFRLALPLSRCKLLDFCFVDRSSSKKRVRCQIVKLGNVIQIANSKRTFKSSKFNSRYGETSNFQPEHSAVVTNGKTNFFASAKKVFPNIHLTLSLSVADASCTPRNHYFDTNRKNFSGTFQFTLCKRDIGSTQNF